ncbi:unnamed protein product [Psylliodes chrysocephalus]|uniref:Uncharacterized protein n=1 Tax=Psylliodes chrysocephalus TaxID=3402493 RepID=A0A9P0GAZ8_9CUCU|nr:unnamed protein product [Psylliodes chrysocephala]
MVRIKSESATRGSHKLLPKFKGTKVLFNKYEVTDLRGIKIITPWRRLKIQKIPIENSYNINAAEILFNDGYDSDKDPEFVVTEAESSDSSLEQEDSDHLEKNENNNNVGREAVKSLRPKRGKKRISPNMTRAENKQAKNAIKTHYEYKRKTVEEKKLDEAFQCSCSKKCNTTLNLTQQQKCFKKFWELGSYNAQTAYIGALVKEYDKKRNYVLAQKPKKYFRIYQLDGVTICHETFIRTLRISTKRVNSALTKLRSESITDKRGKLQGGKNKIDAREQEVINQINKIPKYKSHYRRAQCSNAEFLPPEITWSLMYRKYKEETEKPMDTCNTCDSYHSKLQNALTPNEKEKIKEEHDNHIKSWQDARNQMKNDMKKAKESNEIECLTFDLEKTLPLPRLATGILFYKRQIWLYNLAVHSGSTNKGYFYV